MQKQKKLRKKETYLSRELNNLNIGNEKILHRIETAISDLNLEAANKFNLSNDAIDKWRHYGIYPSDTVIRQAIAKVINQEHMKKEKEYKRKEYYEIIFPEKHVIKLLKQAIQDFNSKIDTATINEFKQKLVIQRPQFTTMRNELSSHARWNELFEAICFCQLIYFSRSNHLKHIDLNIKLYEQLMKPSTLVKLTDRHLLMTGVKEYVNSTPVIYDRSVQLIAVRSLLMSIDGNYLFS